MHESGSGDDAAEDRGRIASGFRGKMDERIRECEHRGKDNCLSTGTRSEHPISRGNGRHTAQDRKIAVHGPEVPRPKEVDVERIEVVIVVVVKVEDLPDGMDVEREVLGDDLIEPEIIARSQNPDDGGKERQCEKGDERQPKTFGLCRNRGLIHEELRGSIVGRRLAFRGGQEWRVYRNG